MRTAFKVVLASLMFLVAFVSPVAALQTQSNPRDKFRSGGEVTIGAGQTIPHDLYVAAGQVQIDGRIQGDLFVTGGSVEVNGPVEGDLFVAGGNVTVGGPVGGDLRVTGGDVTVESQIGEDLLAAAGTLTIAQAARVGGDLIFSAGNTTLDGAVAGSVLGRGGDYDRAPAVAAPGQTPVPAGVAAPGTVGGSEAVTIVEREGPTLTERIFAQVRRYIGIVLFGLLLLWLAPRVYGAAAAALRERPLRSLGSGVLTVILFVALIVGLFILLIVLGLILGPLGFGALFATAVVGGILLAGLAAFLLVLGASYLAGAVVSVATGRLLLSRASGAARPVYALLLGALIVVILTAIPVLGTILNIAIAIFGLGALAWVLWRRRREGRLAAAA